MSAEQIRHEPRIGDRVVLIMMGDDPDPVPPGSIGTINYVTGDSMGYIIGVQWDSGRSLSLVEPADKWDFVDA